MKTEAEVRLMLACNIGFEDQLYKAGFSQAQRDPILAMIAVCEWVLGEKEDPPEFAAYKAVNQKGGA